MKIPDFKTSMVILAVACEDPDLSGHKTFYTLNPNYWDDHLAGKCRSDFSLVANGKYVSGNAPWSFDRAYIEALTDEGEFIDGKI